MRIIYSLLFILFAVNLSAQCGMNFTVNKTDASCNGMCDGTAIITVTGGTSPYTFSCNDTITNLCAGTYSCAVTDATACSDTVTFTILQPAPLNLTFGVTPGCAGQCNGQVCANVSGGVSPYTFMWTNGSTASCIMGCSGTYTCTVVDANGCSVSQPVTLNNTLQPPVITGITSSAGDTLSSCGMCTNLMVQLSSGGPIMVNWSGGCGSFNGASFQICNLNYGGCTTTVTVTNSNGCTASATKTIYGPPPITSLTAQVKNDSCNQCVGAVYNVNAGGGSPPYSYSWTGPFNYSSSQQNISNVCGGTYTLVVTDTNQCTKTQTYSPGNALNSYLTVTGTNPNCPNTCTGSATVSYTGPNAPYTYQWNTVPPQATATASNLCPGIYDCTVTDAAGCMATISKAVTAVYTTPGVAPTGSVNPTCGLCNGSLFIPFSPGYTTTVTGPGGYSATGTNFSGLCAGTYTITATRPGCQTFTNTATLLLQSGSIPGLTLTPAVNPESCTGMHDGSVSLTASGSVSPLSYLWSNGMTATGITNLYTGNYIVTITDTSGNCHKQTFNVPLSSSNCGYITGKVFGDLNSDCAYNLADYGISGSMVVASPGNYYGITNASGNYSIQLPLGTYTVQHYPNQQGYVPHCVTTQTVTTAPGNITAANIDFPDSLNPLPDLKVGYIIVSQPVPGFPQSINFSVSNASVFYSTPLDGVVKLKLNTDQYFSSATPPPSATAGDTLIWNFSGLNPFSSLNYSVSVTVAANVALLGNVLSNCANVSCTNQTDMVPWNNTWCDADVIVGAYDPNDKGVTPIGENSTGDIFMNDSVFTYKIRFQNTGTAPAHDVVILDTISPKLDLTTFEFLGSSHTCAVDFIAGDVARFSFINIMLPDSNANEPASHGWLQYRIKKKASTTIGDQILNTAHIYFDFNPAIVTNTTINTYTIPTDVNETVATQVLMFPNPAKEILYIREAGNNRISSVELTDVSGKKVLSQQTNQSIVSLSLSGVAPGVYLVKVSSGDASTVKKLIITR